MDLRSPGAERFGLNVEADADHDGGAKDVVVVQGHVGRDVGGPVGFDAGLPARHVLFPVSVEMVARRPAVVIGCPRSPARAHRIRDRRPASRFRSLRSAGYCPENAVPRPRPPAVASAPGRAGRSCRGPRSNCPGYRIQTCPVESGGSWSRGSRNSRTAPNTRSKAGLYQRKPRPRLEPQFPSLSIKGCRSQKSRFEASISTSGMNNSNRVTPVS